MSIHIGAKPGDIAETVLMPGDPLRAKFIAEKFLESPVCYNTVRGMFGYTGKYKGRRISIQGSGMGIPSISIYSNELISEFGAKRLVRIGSCGTLRPEIKLRDIIIGMAASTDSAINKIRFGGMDFAPTASFSLLKKAYDVAASKGIDAKVGNILSTDTFYGDDPDSWKLWAKFGVLAVEMEAAALYTIAAKFNAEALCILTVSDSLVTHEKVSSEDREKTFTSMMEIALELA